MFKEFLSLFISFLIGSIPFAVIVSKRYGVTIQKIGSGNPGFANVVRALGVRKALPVLFGDVLKGYVGAYAAIFLGGTWLVAILGPVLGHCFSPWLGFRGGKGVATFLGSSFFVSFWLGLVGILLWCLVFFITKITSVSSFVGIAGIIMFSLYAAPHVALPLAIAGAVILGRHADNMIRIYKNKELTFNVR